MPRRSAQVGDVGFDPLGFTEVFSLEWLREAEIKHARVSMLAFVGFVRTSHTRLKNAKPNPLRETCSMQVRERHAAVINRSFLECHKCRPIGRSPRLREPRFFTGSPAAGIMQPVVMIVDDNALDI